jgi:integrase
MKRRGRNEGSIRRRKDGRWQATVSMGWKNGKRARKFLYGETREEVAGKLTRALNAQQQGLPIAGERQTLEQFLDVWLEAAVKGKVRPLTFESYRSYIVTHLKPGLGKKTLARLSPQDVQAFLNAKSAEKDDQGNARFAARTVQYMHAVLRRALGQAERWGLVARNVAKLVEARVRRQEIEPLSVEQARLLLEAARGDRLEALVTVATSLGLRQAEALGLRWESIDLEAGRLTVRESLQRIDGKLSLVDVKTDKSRRTVTLPRFTVSALKAHRARQLQERLVAGTRWQDRGLVFSSTIGTPLDRWQVHRRYHELLLKAGVPRKRFHDLRHTSASLLFAQGVEPRVVMEILGHSRIATTLDIYTHLLPHAQQDAADKMDAILAT